MPKGIPKTPLLGRTLKSFAAFAANDRGQGHEFWLFHGINYLSDNPFPGIYKGDKIYRASLFAHIMAKHMEGDHLTERGQECLVWASTNPKELFRAVAYIKGFARKYKRDPFLPDDPYVRVAVETTAKLMVAATKGWGNTDPLIPKDYYAYHRRYSLDIRKAATNVLRYDPRTRRGWEFWADVHRQTIAKYGLPPDVEPFRLEYKERNDRGYLVHTGWMEEVRQKRKGQ